MRASCLRSGAMIIILVVAVLTATSAPAATAAKQESGCTRGVAASDWGGPYARRGPVPKRPFAIIEYYFPLSKDRLAAVRALRAQWINERAKGIAALEKQLDADFHPKLAALLSKKDRPKFKQVGEAVRIYHAAVGAAGNEYRKAWKQVTGKKASWLPSDVMQIVQVMPGVHPTRRVEILRSIQRGIRMQEQAKVTQILKKKGIRQPTDPRKNPDLWRKYLQEYNEIRAQVRKQSEPAMLEKIRKSLPKRRVKLFAKLVRILNGFLAKTDAADKRLKQTLAEIIRPAKAQAPPISPAKAQAPPTRDQAQAPPTRDQAQGAVAKPPPGTAQDVAGDR